MGGGALRWAKRMRAGLRDMGTMTAGGPAAAAQLANFINDFLHQQDTGWALATGASSKHTDGGRTGARSGALERAKASRSVSDAERFPHLRHSSPTRKKGSGRTREEEDLGVGLRQNGGQGGERFYNSRKGARRFCSLPDEAMHNQHGIRLSHEDAEASGWLSRSHSQTAFFKKPRRRFSRWVAAGAAIFYRVVD